MQDVEHDVATLTDHPPDHRQAADSTRPRPQRQQQLGENLQSAAIPLIVGPFIGAIVVSVFVAAFHGPKPHQALSGASYFHNDGVASALLILATWAVAATLLFAAGELVQRRQTTPEVTSA